MEQNTLSKEQNTLSWNKTHFHGSKCNKEEEQKQ